MIAVATEVLKHIIHVHTLTPKSDEMVDPPADLALPTCLKRMIDAISLHSNSVQC